MSIEIPQPLDLEISIRATGSGVYAANLCLNDLENATSVDPAVDIPVRLDSEMLRAVALDPVVYGAQLSAMLFADQRMREGWASATGYAGRSGGAIRLRLCLDETDPLLYTLRWELLLGRVGRIDDVAAVFGRDDPLAPRLRGALEGGQRLAGGPPNRLIGYLRWPAIVHSLSARFWLCSSSASDLLLPLRVADWCVAIYSTPLRWPSMMRYRSRSNSASASRMRPASSSVIPHSPGTVHPRPRGRSERPR
jgi:hypothetical protein